MRTQLRTPLVALAVATASVLLPCTLIAAAPDDQAVLHTVQTLFDGMAHRDPATVRSAFLPGATLVLMRDGKPTRMTIETFAQRTAPGSTTVEERIHDPLVRIDRDLAVVWAPFEVLVDGKVNHCGTDLFDLVRVDGRWLIASAADTGRRNCPTRPPRPQP